MRLQLRMDRNTRTAAALLAIAVATTTGATAATASQLVIRGHGYGHGVGMSQYGAYGYAKHGFDYQQILAHYYTGTALTTLKSAPRVGVLLAASRSRASFTGATRAGSRKLSPTQTYVALPNGGGGTVLQSSSGRVLQRLPGLLRVSAGGAAPVRLLGTGRYRGALEFRATATGAINVVNSVGVETYVRGVVAAESPSSWPQDALRAQAIAARTYALTTDAGSKTDGFTQYPDTRSQVYKGVAAETASTDAAIKATRLQVVTYAGKPVPTYFFSTSGGRTENIENSFVGAAPQPYLKSVEDPYDDLSPKHTWGPITLSDGQTRAKLGDLLKGSLVEIKVTKRGVSPRVVQAQIVGTGGTTAVTGADLRRRLGLFDTWATFTVTGADGQQTTSTPAQVTTAETTPTTPPVPGDPGNGGVGPQQP
jgi:stage II sporulation protein D